jgi:hypothetical protein
MSSQRSDWRERLHANPSRMKQELAIKLENVTRNKAHLRSTPIETAQSKNSLILEPTTVTLDNLSIFRKAICESYQER